MTAISSAEGAQLAPSGSGERSGSRSGRDPDLGSGSASSTIETREPLSGAFRKYGDTESGHPGDAGQGRSEGACLWHVTERGRRPAPPGAARMSSYLRKVPLSFGDRVASQVAERGSQLVLGLDPDPARLWPRAIELAGRAGDSPAPPAVLASQAVATHCPLMIEAVADEWVASPQRLERLRELAWNLGG